MIKKIPDERGFVGHILKISDDNFAKLGEIAEVYCSSAYPGVIKGWHFHHEMDMLYTCISGNAQVVVQDESGGFVTYFIGDNHYDQVFIPKHTWNAFRALGNQPCLIVNITNMVHDPREIQRMDDDLVKYDWDFNT